MSATTDISVIVPTYNSAATLGRALQSLLRQQTAARVEIIISDDASTDGTLAVAEDFATRYPDTIRLLTSDRNRGVAVNYFDALSQCRGRYITDCADDDYWLGTDTLDNKFRALESHAEAVAVYSPWMEVHPDHTIREHAGFGRDIPAESAASHEFMLALLRRTWPAAMHLSTVLYRASVVTDALARRRDVICNPHFGFEDTSIMLALAAAGTIIYDHRPSLAYSVGHASISNDSDAGRRAIFSARASLACRRLALYYGIPLRLVADSLRHHLTYALGQARHSNSREVKREVARAVSECGISLGLRGYVLRLLNL
ncbi:MAG: glycosyltransferase family 2 protein [Paramuribaculum sp.]|nr:glycosyltransferase family 2 protein [Paramuribaculum sp.]